MHVHHKTDSLMHVHHNAALVRLAWMIVALSACASAQSLVESDTLARTARHWDAFGPTSADVPDPDPTRDALVLRPRFGAPAIIAADTAFAVETLVRGRGIDQPVRAAMVSPTLDDAAAQKCLAAADIAPSGCVLLDVLAVASDTIVTGGAQRFVHVHQTARARSAASPGAWDLMFGSSVDAPMRLPRAVFVRAEAPTTPATIRVAQLSDLHVGKGDAEAIETHLRQVIADLNARAVDLVIVTGDVANWGGQQPLFGRARDILLAVNAPLLIIVGNHDLGFGSSAILGHDQFIGWSHFARAFHPLLFFTTTLGGWDFVGFDSGPSTPSPYVFTRGLAPEALVRIGRALDDARTSGRRGVVLFSHAPSRARLTEGSPEAIGLFGRMRDGHDEFERLILDAAVRGQRVLHLAGHTHWSDTFEAMTASTGEGLAFRRWPSPGGSCATPIPGNAALITTQSATHPSPLKESGAGWGYALVTLGEGAPTLERIRFGLRPEDATCSPASSPPGDARKEGPP